MTELSTASTRAHAEQLDDADPLAGFRLRFEVPDPSVVYLDGNSLGRLPAAVRVDVLAEHPDGRRTVVSHFNKAHKGRLARALATTRAEPSDAAAVATVARRAGMRVERDGDDLVVVVAA